MEFVYQSFLEICSLIHFVVVVVTLKSVLNLGLNQAENIAKKALFGPRLKNGSKQLVNNKTLIKQSETTNLTD